MISRIGISFERRTMVRGANTLTTTHRVASVRITAIGRCAARDGQQHDTSGKHPE